MPTTTNYGWTTPADTDLVKDGAAAIRTLGSSVDTTTKNLNPQTTTGAIAYRSSTSNVNTSLPIGTAGQVLTVNSGATAPEWATAPSSTPTTATATVASNQTTTSNTFTDLATAGPAVTVTTGTKALVIVTASLTNGGAAESAYMDFDISGATTRAASITTALQVAASGSNAPYVRASAANLMTVTAGSNTFTAKYSTTNANTARFINRTIFVMNLG